MMIEEIKRSLYDVLCVVCNLIWDKVIVYGGGVVEILCFFVVEVVVDKIFGVE